MNEIAAKIVAEISAAGVIPFARFMQLALYCPIYGYYEREKDTIGREGDYYTSVSVGSLFGELLAAQFADWMESSPEFSQHGPVRIVEAGAHDGRLARDILAWLRKLRSGLLQRLEYWIVEPSARRRQSQERMLAEFAGKVRWAVDLDSLTAIPHSALRTPRVMGGILFSNELLDALPVHRLGWDARQRCWFEWGVRLDAGLFRWARMEPGILAVHAPWTAVDPDLPQLNSPELLAVLPDGFTIEVCPAAEAWWRQAASVLAWGKLVTIDYGLAAEEFFTPERKEGTLRAYYRHQVSGDLLARPGEQDLTAQVNFSAIQAAGESAGLRTETFVTQDRFLTQIAARIWNGTLAFDDWTPSRTRQFQTLTHPQHLGRPFQVLVQASD